MLTLKVANLISQQGESSRCMVHKTSCKKKKILRKPLQFLCYHKEKRHTIKYSCNAVKQKVPTCMLPTNRGPLSVITYNTLFSISLERNCCNPYRSRDRPPSCGGLIFCSSTMTSLAACSLRRFIHVPGETPSGLRRQ